MAHESVPSAAELESKLRVFRNLFDWIMAELPRPRVAYFEDDDYPLLHLDTVDPSATHDWVPWKEPQFPRTTPKIRAAFRKSNYCELAVYIFQDLLNATFGDQGFSFGPLNFQVRPRLQLYTNADVCTNNHTVIRMEDPSGNRHIVDFTLEQFGFAKDDWFLLEDEYMDLYNPTPAWRERSRPILRGAPWREPRFNVIKALLDGTDWETILGMEEGSRRREIYSIKCQIAGIFQLDVLRTY